ncbi:hypothetical protein ANCDUO_21875, partial [Ancylostoma duodenale]
ALPKNPRLSCDEESKFAYKPPYKIKGKTSLVAVAKKHHQDVKGGILLSELNDCIPNGEKVLEYILLECFVNAGGLSFLWLQRCDRHKCTYNLSQEGIPRFRGVGRVKEAAFT